jgi:hypothetical protein
MKGLYGRKTGGFELCKPRATACNRTQSLMLLDVCECDLVVAQALGKFNEIYKYFVIIIYFFRNSYASFP